MLKLNIGGAVQWTTGVRLPGRRLLGIPVTRNLFPFKFVTVPINSKISLK